MTLGLHVELRLQVPPQRQALSIETAAVRWVSGNRYGVEFLAMTTAGRQHLYRCVIEALTHAVPGLHETPDH